MWALYSGREGRQLCSVFFPEIGPINISKSLTSQSCIVVVVFVFRLFSLIQGPSMSPGEKEGSGIPRTHNNFTSFHRSTRDDDDEAKPTFCQQEHPPSSSSPSQSIFVSSN